MIHRVGNDVTKPRQAATYLPKDSVVQVYCTVRPRDGEVMGYAIRDGDSWDGYYFIPSLVKPAGMRRCACGVTREEAIAKITECWW